MFIKNSKKTYLKSMQGQTALFAATMLSLAAVAITYFAASRMLFSKKIVINVNYKQQAYEALDTMVTKLSQAYAEKSCDPGLFFNSGPMSMTNANLLTPHALTSSLTFRGQLIPIGAPNNTTSPYQAPYNQKGVLYYPVYIQKVHTLERLDIAPNMVTTDREILFPDPTGTNPMVVIPMGQARSPSLGINFTSPSATGNLPLGIRDVSIELSVVYPPPNTNNNLIGMPRNVLTQTVVLVNSCIGSGTGASQRYYLPINVSFIGFSTDGKGCKNTG